MIRSLQRLQNRAAKIIAINPYDYSATYLLNSYLHKAENVAVEKFAGI